MFRNASAATRPENAFLRTAIYVALFVSSLAHSAVISPAGPDANGDLGEMIRRVWASSPQLRAQSELAQLAARDRRRRWLMNEPLLTYSSSDDDVAHGFGLSLAIGFPGKAFALSALDDAKADGQRLEISAKKHDLAKLITGAFIDCASAHANFKLLQLSAADLSGLFQTLKARYESGHSTQAEKIGAELQSRQAQSDLASAEDKQHLLCAKLSTVLQASGVPPSADTGATLPDDLDAGLIEEIGIRTADSTRSESAARLAQVTSKTASWAQAPDFTIAAARNQYLYLPGSPSGKEWTTTYSVAVTFPLLYPFYEGTEAGRTREQATIDRNVAELARVAADSDGREAAAEYRRARSRLKELREKDLSLAEALVESTSSAYRAGKLGYAELILSRKTLSELRAQDVSLRAAILSSHLRCLGHCLGETTSGSRAAADQNASLTPR